MARRSSPRPKPTSEYCRSARKGPRHPARPRFHPRDAFAAGAGARPRYCHPAAPDSVLAGTRLDAPEQHLHRQLPNPLRGILWTDHRAPWRAHRFLAVPALGRNPPPQPLGVFPDRKSTRLNSSHLVISYAVFFLKKKTKQQATTEVADHLKIELSHANTLHDS